MRGSNGLQSPMLLKVQESPQLKVNSVPTNPSFPSTRPLCVFFSTTKDDVLLYCRQVQKVAWSMKLKEVPALGNHCGRAKIWSRFISIYVLFFCGGGFKQSTFCCTEPIRFCTVNEFSVPVFSNWPCWHISMLPHKRRPDWDHECSSAFQASWQTSGLRCSELDLNYNH